MEKAQARPRPPTPPPAPFPAPRGPFCFNTIIPFLCPLRTPIFLLSIIVHYLLHTLFIPSPIFWFGNFLSIFIPLSSPFLSSRTVKLIIIINPGVLIISNESSLPLSLPSSFSSY